MNEIVPGTFRASPPAPSFALVDPASIIVSRGSRQRSDVIDTTDVESSIARLGQLQPIIVTRDLTLVAGERRLRACLNLKRPVAVRYLDELTPVELKLIEFEENAKRRDLPWRDFVRAVGEIHALHVAQDAKWTLPRTAESLGYAASFVFEVLTVYRELDSERLAAATGIRQAYQLLVRVSERRAAELVNDILHQGAKLFGKTVTKTEASDDDVLGSGDVLDSGADLRRDDTLSDLGDALADPVAGPHVPRVVSDLERTLPKKEDIIQANFITWSEEYSGPKFSLIHCDFPYGTLMTGEKRGSEYRAGESIYDDLLDALCTNFDRFASYSCHLVFWFSMNFYERTRKRLESLGLRVDAFPLVWHDTGGYRIVPVPGRDPGHVYHTAFFASRGERPLVKTRNNAYAAPGVSKPIHPSQKPQPMLEYFLSMVVDETTEILDPTCGSASALLAAESLGAKRVLGLELDPEHARMAAEALRRSRLLAQAQGKIIAS